MKWIALRRLRAARILTMKLTRHEAASGSVWAVDGKALDVTLSELLAMRSNRMVEALVGREPVGGRLLSPCDPHHEVWASGVTYLRSRLEREAESSVADVYAKVYDAERPEIFFKAIGWRVVPSEGDIRIRRDSSWNVPEPELTLVVNRFAEIVGYTAGNDVSSRSIEGENPLYLPQAKSYDGSCALGPAIMLGKPESVPIKLSILRGSAEVYGGETNTDQMRRTMQDLVEFLFRETSFPNGVFLLTGTGIVPPQGFTLEGGDEVRIDVGELTLVNRVTA